MANPRWFLTQLYRPCPVLARRHASCPCGPRRTAQQAHPIGRAPLADSQAGTRELAAAEATLAAASRLAQAARSCHSGEGLASGADSQVATRRPMAAEAGPNVEREPTQGTASSSRSSPWHSMSDGSQGTGVARVQKFVEARAALQSPSILKPAGANTELDAELAATLSIGGEEAAAELASAESLVKQSEEIYRWNEQRKELRVPAANWAGDERPKKPKGAPALGPAAPPCKKATPSKPPQRPGRRRGQPERGPSRRDQLR